MRQAEHPCPWGALRLELLVEVVHHLRDWGDLEVPGVEHLGLRGVLGVEYLGLPVVLGVEHLGLRWVLEVDLLGLLEALVTVFQVLQVAPERSCSWLWKSLISRQAICSWT